MSRRNRYYTQEKSDVNKIVGFLKNYEIESIRDAFNELGIVEDLPTESAEPTVFPITSIPLDIRIPMVVPTSFAAGSGGVIGITRNRETLNNCTAYRAWRNTTGGTRDRTISVYPSSGVPPLLQMAR